MKKNKSILDKDRVKSDTFHVGIELELLTPHSGSDAHDDDACNENRFNMQRRYLHDEGARDILENYLNIPRAESSRVAEYFALDRWIDDYMNDWSDDGCDDSHCGYRSGSGDDIREEMRQELVELTGNQSFKVVPDGSLSPDGDETDTEVCWNYFASKDTLADNASPEILHAL